MSEEIECEDCHRRFVPETDWERVNKRHEWWGCTLDDCEDDDDDDDWLESNAQFIEGEIARLTKERDEARAEVERLNRELEGVRAHMDACRSLTHCPTDEVLYEHLKAFFTGQEVQS